MVHEAGAVEPPERLPKLWFMRVDQTKGQVLRGIPQRPRREISWSGPAPPRGATAEQVADFLAANGVCLEVVAKERHAAMGGDDGADLANHVATPFSAVMLKMLDLHAQGQLHACHAV